MQLKDDNFAARLKKKLLTSSYLRTGVRKNGRYVIKEILQQMFRKF